MKILTLGICLSLSGLGLSDDYPDHWWKPVPKEQLPDWEIPPQNADRSKGEVILSKRNELGLLSNFAETPFRYDGENYKSVEGFWQMLLYPEDTNDPRRRSDLKWSFSRAQVSQMIGFEAKHAGDAAEANMKKLRINWVTYGQEKLTYRTTDKGDHYQLIKAVTLQKVLQNENVKAVLLKTGNLRLRPDHHEEPNASPAWRYFEILMQIRGELD